jgi:poly[(R)-3-hydroxyalkanoate] polymerase subunit PhaC
MSAVGAQYVVETAKAVAREALRRPLVLVEQQTALLQELVRIATGESTLVPDEGDRRFQDPAFSQNVVYRSWLQAYVAWRNSARAFVDKAGLPAITAARAQFLLSLVTEAAAPTNFLLGNPAALKRAIDTGGVSLIRGLQNLASDLAINGGMPSMVDRSAFQVGRNLALSPGAVVFRNELLELIQYAPAGEEVYTRPLLFVPPQINKYYFLDLAPGRSLIEHAVKLGLQVFAISWRNPSPAHRDWGLKTYARGMLAAIDAARAIMRSPDVNVLAACAGGTTLLTLLGHLAAKRDRRVGAVTLMVSLVDTAAGSQLGLFATPETVALAKRVSRRRGVLPGKAMERVFAWLRPNDLVWNYWVNNYLMGNEPPSFDLLYWNSDSTRLPARLHGELLDWFTENPFRTPGWRSPLGTRIDLSKVKSDAYVVAGMTDHITPWKGCYAATQVLGGKSEFVLGSAGHTQSILSAPGNSKAKFFTNPETPASPDEWLAGAQPQWGSWWDHWREWVAARSGPKAKAKHRLGRGKYAARESAPGTYVLET